MKQEGWMANVKGTHVALSRGSLHRLIRPLAMLLLLRMVIFRSPDSAELRRAEMLRLRQ
jgi:hypothetical protein